MRHIRVLLHHHHHHHHHDHNNDHYRHQRPLRGRGPPRSREVCCSAVAVTLVQQTKAYKPAGSCFCCCERLNRRLQRVKNVVQRIRCAAARFFSKNSGVIKLAAKVCVGLIPKAATTLAASVLLPGESFRVHARRTDGRTDIGLRLHFPLDAATIITCFEHALRLFST